MAESRMQGEKARLINLSYVIKKYMRDHDGKIPVNLSDLKDLANLPAMLEKRKDPRGDFSERYAFLPSLPWIQAGADAPRQVILISVSPLPDGNRGVIWRFPDGTYGTDLVPERELKNDPNAKAFEGLKAMGGGIPEPTHKAAESPITAYQAEVLRSLQPKKPEAINSPAAPSGTFNGSGGDQEKKTDIAGDSKRAERRPFFIMCGAILLTLLGAGFLIAWMANAIGKKSRG